MGTLNSQADIQSARSSASVSAMYVATQQSGLNIRKAPSTSGAVIVSLPRCSKVMALDASLTDADWRAVEFDNNGTTTYGFASAKYLAVATPQLNTQAEVKTASAYAKTTEMTITTETSNLNLRAQPTTSSAVLTSVPKGTKVSVLDAALTISGWRAVVADVKGKEVCGFMSADYLTGSTAVAANAGEETHDVPEATQNVKTGGSMAGGSGTSASW